MLEVVQKVFNALGFKQLLPHEDAESNAKFLSVTVPAAAISHTCQIKIAVNNKIIVELPAEIDASQLKKVLEACVACG